MGETLVILGASVRAAAFSARRGGFEPVCGDLFADADLRSCCHATPTANYPAGLLDIADEAPPGPWLYTGGLENYPELIERLSRRRFLLGVGAEALQRVRNPFQLASALGAAGLPFPEVVTSAAGLPIDGSWLLKNRRSSGGGQVFAWQGQAPRASAGWYLQRRIVGLPCAALFVAAEGKAVLLGATRQLLGDGAGKIFCYAGSIGPWPLSPRQRATFQRVGDVLASEFELCGVFGVDAILAGDEAWLVEVNPRYVASAEVLERANDWSAIALHVAACREHALPLPPAQSAGGACCGKAICYAPRDVVIGLPLAESWLAESRCSAWPELADVPVADVRIGAGQPVVTALAAGEDPDLVRRELAEQIIRRLGQLLGDDHSMPTS